MNIIGKFSKLRTRDRFGLAAPEFGQKFYYFVGSTVQHISYFQLELGSDKYFMLNFVFSDTTSLMIRSGMANPLGDILGVFLQIFIIMRPKKPIILGKFSSCGTKTNLVWRPLY
jgi:hypothetical protein